MGSVAEPIAAARRRPVRIALVGVGLIGRHHLELIQASPRAELAAIVDPDPTAMALGRAAGVPCYADIADMLASMHPDGVIVATPSVLHRTQAEACLVAGVPVLVEKPVTTDVGEGERLAELAERTSIAVLVGHHRRHSPRMAVARQMIHEGRLGRLVAVTATTMFSKPPEYFAAAPWRTEPGGGPILINLIHDVDALRMLAGDVSSVQAVSSTLVRGHAVEETVAIALRFANGALGTMMLSDVAASPISWEMTSGEDPAFSRYGHRDCYVLAGTHATLGVPTMRLTSATGTPSWRRRLRSTSVPVARGDPLARQLDHFVDVIRGDADPLVTARDAVETLRVTLAIAEATRAGHVVALDPANGASPPP